MSDDIPAIFFHPDQIEGAGKDLVGRRSAGTGFLNSWLSHAGGSELRILTETPHHDAPCPAERWVIGKVLKVIRNTLVQMHYRRCPRTRIVSGSCVSRGQGTAEPRVTHPIGRGSVGTCH